MLCTFSALSHWIHLIHSDTAEIIFYWILSYKCRHLSANNTKTCVYLMQLSKQSHPLSATSFYAVHLKMSLLRVKPCCLKLNVLISPILWCGFAAVKPQVSILCSVHAQLFAQNIVELFWLCSIKTKRQERVKLLNHAGKNVRHEKWGCSLVP